MKRIVTLLVVFALVLSVAACANSDTGPGTGNEDVLEGGLEGILTKIYASEELSKDFRDYAADGLIISPITNENMEYHLGISGVEFEEAIASEPMMSASAYALCLLRVKDGTDIEKIKKDIKDNVNPQKWVCVGVSPANVIVDNIGDVIILIMCDTNAQALHNAFLDLNK